MSECGIIIVDRRLNAIERRRFVFQERKNVKGIKIPDINKKFTSINV